MAACSTCGRGAPPPPVSLATSLTDGPRQLVNGERTASERGAMNNTGRRPAAGLLTAWPQACPCYVDRAGVTRGACVPNTEELAACLSNCRITVTPGRVPRGTHVGNQTRQTRVCARIAPRGVSRRVSRMDAFVWKMGRPGLVGPRGNVTQTGTGDVEVHFVVALTFSRVTR